MFNRLLHRWFSSFFRIVLNGVLYHQYQCSRRKETIKFCSVVFFSAADEFEKKRWNVFWMMIVVALLNRTNIVRIAQFSSIRCCRCFCFCYCCCCNGSDMHAVYAYRPPMCHPFRMDIYIILFLIWIVTCECVCLCALPCCLWFPCCIISDLLLENQKWKRYKIHAFIQ